MAKEREWKMIKNINILLWCIVACLGVIVIQDFEKSFFSCVITPCFVIFSSIRVGWLFKELKDEQDNGGLTK